MVDKVSILNASFYPIFILKSYIIYQLLSVSVNVKFRLQNNA